MLTINPKDVLILILLIIIFVFLLSTIIFLIWVLRYIEDSSENKRYVYATLNKQARHDSIVFLGDSLTDFYRLDEFFKKKYIYNRGIASNTTDDVLNRLHDNVIDIAPRKIFIQIGINDLGKNKSCQYVIDNIKRIIMILKKELPSVDINVISLYPVNKKAMFTSGISVGKRTNKDVVYINQELKKYCAEMDYTYIDVHSALVDETGVLKKEYTIEGLHISLVGYIKITEILTPYVF